MMRKKILVIEDDLPTVSSLQSLLTNENYKVKSIDNGSEGIKMAKHWQPDLILCDIRIPGKDGFEVLDTLSKNKSTRYIPFIFLTALIEKDYLRRGMMLGADDYIFKPFELDDLLNSIKIRMDKAYHRNCKDKEPKEVQDSKVYQIEDSIIVESGTKAEVFKIKEIMLIRAETPYVNLIFTNGKNSLQRCSLSNLELKLPKNKFCRIHRSTIVNLDHISKLEKIENHHYLIWLKNFQGSLSVSRRYSKKLKSFFLI